MRIEALERHALERVRGDSPNRAALLAVGLTRGDRMRALLRRDDTFEVLAQVLDRIEATLRSADRYAVVSVDELWIWIDDAPSEAIARLAANAIASAVAGFYPGSFDDGTAWSVPIGTSIGGAWTDSPLKASSDLLLAAGRAFTEARAAEDSIVIVPASDDSRQSRARLEARVRSALAGNELELWYQPQVRMPMRRCEAVEGLIRWPRQADGPAISPFTLVQICEESGLIGDLTRFNLNTALRNLAAWNQKGVDVQVSLNLSARTLEDPSFPALVAQACEVWGVPASRLLFELTESSIARNEKASTEFMHRLRDLGCELAIDDFGTGYSSFAYLRNFPVNELKIDRAFVREVTMHAADQRIVKALIEVAHAFGLRALAEGVEDADTVELLAHLGIDGIQGWHFAKAMPASELLEWLRRFSAQARGLEETLTTA
ncbi:MAG: EAL domain-containing protein [Burkholderiales bacterium]|jgi:EAL domain-containing protein (putative c-di-GMP-specific phosphodiesterase class I)/GGDEF domain-containing protein